MYSDPRARPSQTQGSAYFSYRSERSDILMPTAKTDSEYVREYRNVVDPISFPQQRSILWDRTPISSPKYILPADIFPQIYIPNEFIDKIMPRLFSGGGFVESALALEPSHHALSRVMQNSNSYCRNGDSYILLFKDSANLNIGYYEQTAQSNSDMKRVEVSIPFEKGQKENLSFDKDSVNRVVDNMAAEMRASSELFLKSCMRIRGIGYSKQSGKSYFGTIRMEAVIPNISFQAVRVNSIPFLSTTISQRLSELNPYVGPTFGYLTMNQTRKLVAMSSADTAVSMCPIVGVWVRTDEQKPKESNTKTSFSNPILWAACIKFLASERVKDRALVSTNTFLLAHFSNNCETRFFEMTLLPAEYGSPACENKSHDSTETTKTLYQDDFVVLDFTADVSTDDFSRESDGGMLCVFKKVGRKENKKVESNIKPRLSVSQTLKLSIEPYVSMESFKNIAIKEMNTPQPRSCPPLPAQYSRSLTSSLKINRFSDTHESFSEATNRSRTSQSINFGSPGVFSSIVNRIDSRAFTPLAEFGFAENPSGTNQSENVYPARIVLAQQLQIDQLTRQVEELKQIVLSLGGSNVISNSSPTKSSNCDARSIEIESSADQNKTDKISWNSEFGVEQESVSNDHVLENSSGRTENDRLYTPSNHSNLPDETSFVDHNSGVLRSSYSSLYKPIFEESESIMAIESKYLRMK